MAIDPAQQPKRLTRERPHAYQASPPSGLQRGAHARLPILQKRTHTLKNSNNTMHHCSTSLEFCTKHPGIPRLRNGWVLDVPVRVGAALAGTARLCRPTEAHNDASARSTWTSGPRHKSRKRRHVQRCTNPTYPCRWRIRVAARVLRRVYTLSDGS